MGNRTSTISNPLYKSYSQYGSIGEDSSSLNNSTEQLEFYPRWKRRLALGSILICQLFNWVVFNTVTIWIPLSLQLNIYFFSDGAKQDVDGYYRYMERVQLIPIVSLILLYVSGWVAGMLMDSCIRKTHFVLVAQVIATLGYGYQTGIILSLSNNIECVNQTSNSTPMSCHIKEFALCLSNHTTDGYCLDVYTGCTYIISIFSGVVLIGLPALGGDQIPDRSGVRQFYASFYWCRKAGEALSAVLCCVYLVVWNDYKPGKGSSDSDYGWLFFVWSGTILVACVLALVAVFVVVCGKITRQATPRFRVIKDTFSMLREAYRRRKEKEEDESWLDLAKRSNGGSFADRAVEDRVDMFKFALVILLLIPMAFATTVPLLPVVPQTNETQMANETMHNVLDQSVVTVVLSMVRYMTAIIAIPVIHILRSYMARCHQPLSFLHKFIGGHFMMVACFVVIIVMQNLPPYTADYSIPNQVAPMILLGITKAFIYTSGYELTFISASRAMQGSAMGIFYLMDGIANILNLIILLYRNSNSKNGTYSLRIYNLINGIGGLGGIIAAILLLILLEKKYNLGLNRF